MKNVFIIISSIILSGCITNPKPIKLYSTFNPNDAKYILSAGNITVSGQMFLRQRGGGVVTCAGNELLLVPVTKYAEVRFMHIYGNSISSGYRNINSPIEFNTTPAEYFDYTRKTLCDADGRFQFNKVPEGDYFISGFVIWTVGKYSEGGSLFKRIRVVSDSNEMHIITH